MLHDARPFQLQIATILMIGVLAASGAGAEPPADGWRYLAGGQPGDRPEVLIDRAKDAAIEVRVSIPGIDLRVVEVGGRPHTLVSIPGCHPLIEAGCPELPVLARALRLPAEGSPRLEIVEAVWQTLAAPPPLPSRGPLSRDRDPEREPWIFGEVYRQDGVWPAEAAEIGRPFLVRDQRGVALRIHPVRWDAGAGRLEALERLTIRIVTEGRGGPNALAGEVRPAGRSFEPLLRAIFSEPGPDGAKDRADDTAIGADGAERLLMVTASALRTEVDALVQWQQERGYAVEIVDVAEVGGTAPGIQAAVRERYHTEQGLAHLLLVGDAAQVPTNLGTYHGAPSDGTYGLVAGDDLFVDVLVSRLPARSADELRIMIDRTVTYERQPQPDGAWYTMSAGVASDEGVPADYLRADQLRDSLLAASFTEVARIYQNQGGSRASIAGAVNGGASLVNYIGHGSGTGWLSVPFASADVHGLTNTTAWPWIIDVACSNGDLLLEECFAAAWLRARHQDRPTGAVAVVAASSLASWVPPCVMQARMIERLTVEGQTEVGSLLAAGVAAVLVQYDGTDEGRKLMEQYNLFGVGTLQVRSRRPAPLVVAHPPVLAAGRSVLEVDAPAGAVAVLGDGRDVLARAVRIGADPLRLWPERELRDGETVRLTVTAPDAVPYRVELTVGSAAGDPMASIPAPAGQLGAWPNPFNPRTTVGFALAEGGAVRLAVHDARGRLVRVLVEASLPAGGHQAIWDGRDQAGRAVAGGIYLARLRTAAGEQVRKLTLAR